MDYVSGCARTIQVTPGRWSAQGIGRYCLWNIWVYVGIGKEKYPGRVERNVGNVVGRSSVKERLGKRNTEQPASVEWTVYRS